MIEVVVGNIGTVYEGQDRAEADKVYAEYVRQSEGGYGRAAGEGVTLFVDGEIVQEHFGDAGDTYNVVI